MVGEVDLPGGVSQPVTGLPALVVHRPGASCGQGQPARRRSPLRGSDPRAETTSHLTQGAHCGGAADPRPTARRWSIRVLDRVRANPEVPCDRSDRMAVLPTRQHAVDLGRSVSTPRTPISLVCAVQILGGIRLGATLAAFSPDQPHRPVEGVEIPPRSRPAALGDAHHATSRAAGNPAAVPHVSSGSPSTSVTFSMQKPSNPSATTPAGLVSRS